MASGHTGHRRLALWFPTWRTDRLKRAWKATGKPLPAEPLLIARQAGNRQEVAAVSAEAAALGLRVGEPLAAARARIPALHVVELDEAADAAALERLGQWALSRYSPLVALDPPDGLMIEAHGASHLWGGEARMLADIERRWKAAGIQLRAGLAPTALAARALARHGAEPFAIVPPAGLPQAIAGLPVAALGIAADEAAALTRLGLATLGDLEAVPRAAAGRRLGLQTLRRLDAAFGRLSEPMAWLEPPKRLFATLDFPEPIVSADAIAEAIRRLVGALVESLAASGLGARRLDLRFRRLDGSEAALRAGTAAPSRDARHLSRLLLLLVEGVDPGFGIEAARLSAVLVAPLAPEQTGEARRAAHAFEAAVDRLSTRLGEEALWQAAPTRSAMPERSFARRPAAGIGEDFAWPARLPRPIQLFDPPEPVDAIAMLPDRPPVLFLWRGQRHRVRGADGPERIEGEWWRGDAGESSRVRDYFIVEDEEGARFWLFREGNGEDPATGDMRWYLHGLFGA